MREVGLEEDAVDGQRLEHRGGRRGLEPVARVHLVEVLRRHASPTATCARYGLPRGSCGRRPRARTGSSRCRSRPTRTSGRGSAAAPHSSAGRRPACRSSGTSRPTCTRRWTAFPCAAMRSGVNDDAVSPLPMWKWIGSCASCATAHSGSQCGSPRYGSPKRCGSPVKRMPRCPASMHRSTSATAASMSQNGVDMIVIKRRWSADAQSRRKSLYARTHTILSSSSGN